MREHEQMNSQQARHEQKGKSNDERMAEMLRENDAKWGKKDATRADELTSSARAEGQK
jgi:hypothetical protein